MYDDHPTGVSLFTFILLLSLRKQRKNNFHILSSHSLCGMHGSYNNRSSIFSIYRFCKMSYYLWIWSLLYYIFHLYCCCGRSHNRLHLLPLTRSVLHSLHPTLDLIIVCFSGFYTAVCPGTSAYTVDGFDILIIPILCCTAVDLIRSRSRYNFP